VRVLPHLDIQTVTPMIINISGAGPRTCGAPATVYYHGRYLCLGVILEIYLNADLCVFSNAIVVATENVYRVGRSFDTISDYFTMDMLF